MRSNYRDEIVAEAIAMVEQGYTLRRVQSELRERFPGEPTPDYSCISRWTNNADLQAALEPQESRIAHIAGRIFEDKLEAVESGDLEISFQQAAVGYGIARDKHFKRAELRRGLSPADMGEILAAIAERVAEIRQERAMIAGPVIEGEVIREG